MHWESHMRHRVAVGRGIVALCLLMGCSKERRESTAVAQAKLEVPGLVAAYNFNEGTGTALGDLSTNGNSGVISGAAWAPGIYGQGLSFDGQDDWVTIADASSLDLTTGMTLEAWVNSTARAGFETVVIKEAGTEATYALYGNDHNNAPTTWVFDGASYFSAPAETSLPLNRWSHVAATYDASILRLYVNGVLTASVPAAGPLVTSNDPLRLGGNSISGEWFAGSIDDVRVYNRVLSAAEIEADMDTPIADVPPDAIPPSVAIASPANGATLSGLATISANASDNAALAGVRFLVDGVSLDNQDTSSPYGMTWDTRDLTNGEHTLTARARDTAGNATSTNVTVTIANELSDLVAAYNFDEGEGVLAADASGNSNAAVLSTEAWSTAGMHGGAVSFDGDDWITIADNATLDLTTAMTLEAWVRAASLGSPWVSVFAKEADSAISYGLYASDTEDFGGTNARPGGWVMNDTGLVFSSDDDPLPLDQWIHLAATYEDSTLKFYVNGVIAGTNTGNGPIIPSSGPLRIGGNSIWGEWFDGLVDDVRIYRRALTAAEIQTDMVTPVAPSDCEGAVLDDGNPCTTDTCTPGTGVTHTPVASGTSCTDGNLCNGSETCDAGGTCVAGTPSTCSAIGQCHDAGTCNPATGLCSTPAKADGTVCSDNNACTATDTCQAGTCTPGSAVAVDDANPCTTDSCAPETGVSHTPVSTGTSCSDGDQCNGAETCNANGTCSAGTPVTCTAMDQCHLAGTCNPADGTCSNPVNPEAILDPRSVTPLDPTVVTSFATAAAPLYEGTLASQKPVTAGAINPARIAIIDGHVLDEAGNPAVCAEVTVVGVPQVGASVVREDGSFSIALNGGGPATVRISYPGFIPAHRTVNTLPNRFARASDVRLVSYGTSQPVSAAATTTTVVAGDLETDADGSREAALLFPPGTTASVAGEPTPRSSYGVRVKELTNRSETGREGMPASLPPQSAFTYAISLAVEGAEDKAVTFNQPVPVYVENFLGFPNGENVPVGRFDPVSAQWVAEENGRIVTIAAIAGGQATLDIDGTPGADDPASLGVTTAELTALAARYPVGASLWRFATNHFSDWDANWGWGPPDGAEPPDNSGGGTPDLPEDSCQQPGSIIECENQVLREHVPVTATPFNLIYSSARQAGSARRLLVPLTDATLPPGLQALDVRIEVAGRSFTPILSPTANLTYEFVWDGLDSAGRRLSGPQDVRTSVGYVYNGSYEQTARFGYSGNGIPISGSLDRFQATLWQYGSSRIGNVDARYPGLGNWTLDAHHVLDRPTGTLYLGNGRQQTGESTVLTTIAGTGVNAHTGDGGPATSAAVIPGMGIVVMPDGVVYFLNKNYTVRKIDTNGVISTIAGGLGVFAVPSGLALGPDGDLYVADRDYCRIRKINLSTNVVTTVIGDADTCSSIDGPADPGAPGAARLRRPQGLAFGSDGTLYIAEYNRLRRVRDGQVSTVIADFGLGDLTGVAVRSDGTLFVGAWNFIYKISLNGSVSLIAGGSGSNTADGVPSTSARLGALDGLAVGPDDLLYYADSDGYKIRRINADGTVQTIVGTGTSGFNGDGKAPIRSTVYWPSGLAFGPDGSLYIPDSFNYRVRRVVPKDGINLPSGVFGIASTDGQELYQFDPNGRHLRTLDTHSGATRYTFSYDPEGLLSAVTDSSGRATTIVRSGSTITITAPDQQPTTLLLDAEKNLERITRPDGTFYSFDYASGGLLTSLKDPKANAEGGLPAVFTYDNGLLVEDTDARPGATPQILTRTSLSGVTGWSVTHETPNGRATTYRTELTSGVQKRTITHPDLTTALEEIRADGATVFVAPNGRRYDRHVRQPDGTDIYTLTASHPAYGGQDPNFAEQQTRLPSGLLRLVTQTSAATVNATTGALLSETLTTITNGKPPSTVSYDAATRTFTTTSAAGRSTTTVLDTAGRTSQIAVAGIPNATNFQYDSAGRLSTVTQGTRTTELGYFPPGSALKTGYLQSAQTYAVPSAPLTVTTFDRDALGRVLESVTGDATTSTTWDANGSLSSVIPPGKPTHALVYDPINQLVNYTPPVVPGVPSPGTSYAFDLDRNVETETRPGSILLDPAYDAAGRLDSVAIPGGLLDQTYYSLLPPAGGAPGRLNTLAGPYGINLAYRYDGSLTARVTWSGLVNGNINWTYNSDFLPTIETVTPGTGPAVSMHFGYDVDNLSTCASLTSCSPAASDALSITRSPENGLVSTITLGSAIESYGYNDYGELAWQSSTFGATPLIALSYDTATFPRDALGRIKRKTETVAGITTNFDYTYDDLGRLTDVHRNGVLEEHFDYDDNGNRTLGFNAAAGTTHSGTYDNQDRLLSYGPSTFTYTQNGELATRTTGGQTTTYTYDALGNLLSVALPDGTTIAYLVDGENRRVGKRVNGVLTKQWLYKDGLRPVVELDGIGAVVARFVYASGRHAPEYIIRGGNTYRVLSDQLGSARMAVNVANSSDVPFRADYSSFGEQIMLSGAADWMPFGFAGGMYDADTRLVRFGARDYDAMVGRWSSKDPIGFGGGQANVFAYVGNDPVNGIDPTGLAKDLQCLGECEYAFNRRLEVCTAAGALGVAIVASCVRICVTSSAGFPACMVACVSATSLVTSTCLLSAAINFAACANRCPNCD
jgi:RHS repeat-associated protein